jgi:hypothetical protein
VEAGILRRFANKVGKNNTKDLAQDFRGNILGKYMLPRNFFEVGR